MVVHTRAQMEQRLLNCSSWHDCHRSSLRKDFFRHVIASMICIPLVYSIPFLRRSTFNCNENLGRKWHSTASSAGLRGWRCVSRRSRRSLHSPVFVSSNTQSGCTWRLNNGPTFGPNSQVTHPLYFVIHCFLVKYCNILFRVMTIFFL